MNTLENNNEQGTYLAIAGNIGSGKTTLTELLSKNFGWNAVFENPEDNPYIHDFYEDMLRWSFNLQLSFLNHRFKQLQEVYKSDKTVVQDRTIYEDAYIFAANLHAMGLMTTRDYNAYLDLFESIKVFIKPPDLLIYLRCGIPKLVNQIQKRGREYEENLRLDYIKRLHERYEAWVSTYQEGKLLIIEVDDINFEENPEHLGEIVQRVNAELYGLF